MQADEVFLYFSLAPIFPRYRVNSVLIQHILFASMEPQVDLHLHTIGIAETPLTGKYK